MTLKHGCGTVMHFGQGLVCCDLHAFVHFQEEHSILFSISQALTSNQIFSVAKNDLRLYMALTYQDFKQHIGNRHQTSVFQTLQT